MAEFLTKTVMDDQRENIVDDVVEKVLGSSKYEEYIEDRIANVLGNLMHIPKVDESTFIQEGEKV